jgi:uncharacterized protein
MQVILKATTACNASCRYCSAVPDVNGGFRLKAHELGPLFETFRPWLAADPARTLSFVWHGGEPLLPGLAFFRRAADEQSRVFGPDANRVANRLQSNLTLLDEAWVAFLKGFVKSIGTSFDLVEGVRTTKHGGSVAGRWIEAVTACRQAGIPVGVVYVVHRGSLARAGDLYRFFRNLDERGRVRFNPLYPEGRAATGRTDDLAITAEEYGDFLVEVARLWWDDGRTAAVLPLKEWHDAWRGGGRLSCDSSGSCQERFLGVGPDGSAWGCGRFVDHGDGAWRLGNVFRDDLETILSHPARTRLVSRDDGLREDGCAGCPYFAVCHGGCPMMAQLVHGDALRKTPFCEGRKKVYRFFEERLGPPERA